MAKTPKRPTLRDTACRVAIGPLSGLLGCSGTTVQLGIGARSDAERATPFIVDDVRLDAVLAAANAACSFPRREELRTALGRTIGMALALADRFPVPEPTDAQAVKRLRRIARHCLLVREALDTMSAEESQFLAGYDAPSRDDLVGPIEALATAAERAALDVDGGRYVMARSGRRPEHATQCAVAALVATFREYIGEPRRSTDAEGAESGAFLQFCRAALDGTSLDTGELSWIVRDVLRDSRPTA